MKIVDYPAAISTQTDGNAVLKQYGFWTTLKIMLKGKSNCYPFPVAYTDGLMSFCRQDTVGRVPWGLILGKYILKLVDNPQPMEITQTEAYCKNIVFCGQRAILMPIELLRYIKRNVCAINSALSELGGTLFFHELYRSGTSAGDGSLDMLAMDFEKGHSNCSYVASKDAALFRPVIEIPNF